MTSLHDHQPGRLTPGRRYTSIGPADDSKHGARRTIEVIAGPTSAAPDFIHHNATDMWRPTP